MPLKNIILDRFKLMTEPPNPTLFYVFEHEDGVHIMTQPWGKAKKLTWAQAESYLDMVPRKPMGRAGNVTRINRKQG